MAAPRVRRIASRFVLCALALPVGCISPSRYERKDVTLERIALRDAWLGTIAPFAVAALLALLLVVVWYRRTRNTRLDVLFRRVTVRELADGVRRWWQARRASHDGSASELVSERKRRHADYVAWTAERESQDRLAEEARRNQPPLGPPTLGFFSRVAVGLAAGLGVTALLLLMIASAGPDPNHFLPLVALFVGVVGVAVSLSSSLVCAAMIGSAREPTIPFTTLCAGLGGAAPGMISLKLALVAAPIGFVAGALVVGLAIAFADQASRKPTA
jgi:hypothetical protein